MQVVQAIHEKQERRNLVVPQALMERQGCASFRSGRQAFQEKPSSGLKKEGRCGAAHLKSVWFLNRVIVTLHTEEYDKENFQTNLLTDRETHRWTPSFLFSFFSLLFPNTGVTET